MMDFNHEDDDDDGDEAPAGSEWDFCRPAVCPVHGPVSAVPGNCGPEGWHCLLCVLAAAGTELDAILFAAGCHPFASGHLLPIGLLPEFADAAGLSEDD